MQEITEQSQIRVLAGLIRVSRGLSLRLLEAKLSIHLQRQIEKLKKMILSLGTMVEECLDGAIRAVDSRDTQLAHRVIQSDENINAMEIDVEEECLHTLALHQPVAFDLRYVIAVLKINNELERIADLATNVAKQAEFLIHKPKLTKVPYDLPRMVRMVKTMLHRSLDALVNIDPEVAKSVIAMDDEVDSIHRQMYQDVEQAIRDQPENLESLISLLSISRQMERIADHTVNIAEDVMYMALGEIHRHK